MLKLLNFSCSRCSFPSDHSDHFLVNINSFFEGLLLEAGVDGKTASREACRMEHCLSEGSFEKLAALLGEGAAGKP